MSLEAMVWALKSAPVRDSLAHLVLIGLADHAAGDGTGARPSTATLGRYARCTPRTVLKKLQDLEADGVIVRGDQRAVEHLRADRRPVVYDLNLAVTHATHDVNEIHPVDSHGVNADAARGEPGRTNGVNLRSHKPAFEPSSEPSKTALVIAHDDRASNTPTLDTAFDEFWVTYPRRVGKQAARKAFAKAARTTDPAAIIEGAARYAADPNRVDTFTAHPTTWINRGGWDDDPLPARSDGQDRDAAILRREMAALGDGDLFGMRQVGR